MIAFVKFIALWLVKIFVLYMKKGSKSHRKSCGCGGTRKSQKLYNMKGCSKCGCHKKHLGLRGGGVDPIRTQSRNFNFLNALHGGSNKRGGTCGVNQCGLVGGSNLNYSNISGVGSPETKYYDINKYTLDPQRLMVGGNTRKNRGRSGHKRSGHKRSGGGVSNLMFNDVQNVYRQVTNSLGSAYNTLNGYPAPTNPLPMEGHFKHKI